MLRIIHLSDFHLNQKTLRDWKNYLKDALLAKLHSLNRKIPIDFIAFTGDLIDLGGGDFGNATTGFETFQLEVINPIINEVGLPNEKFFIIPGNHDIVRSLDSKRSEFGNVSYFKDNYNNISEYMIDANKNSDYSGMERMKPYKEFEKKLYNNVQDSHLTMFGSSFKFKQNGNNIGVCCLNSAWRCYDNNDNGRLIVGEEQLSNNFKFIQNTDIKIALLHHPFDWLIDSERGIITNHITKDFDVLLLGHMHESKTSMQTRLTDTLFVNLAPSGLNNIRSDSKTYSNGFTVIDFDKQQRQIACQYYDYNHDNKFFVLNTFLTENGEALYEIPLKRSLKKITFEKNIIENIKEDHFNEMDHHLLGIKAEKNKLSIKEAFVMPPINERHSDITEEDEDADLTLSEIIKSKFNLIFFGDQESGKTTLLYRIVRELVDEYAVTQKIPVYIDFDELQNKEIITAIKEYLRCSSDEVKNLLTEEKLILLIDNLNYKKGYNIDQINKIHKFNKEFQGIQLFASAENLTSGILPTDYLDICKIPFCNYFIKNLRAKEIKSIMRLWIPNEDEINSQLRLDKLISSFNSYALPSSAMSVSLFLWCMEYPERKPINNAVLLEIYIEILLQKLGKHNVYRETFDFTNKIQLLAKIAQEMLSSDKPNYSILFSDFQSIVEKYITDEVAFDFDANVIVEYFLERKLFVKHQHNRIKFTYSCFFHFFIAKRMIFSSDFKSTIIDKDEYYKYNKEIDYYTGLTRSDEDLLKKILERFENVFNSTDFIYDDVDFDKYFTDFGNEKGKPYEPIAKDIETSKIKENRPTEQMMERYQNQRLEQIPNPNVIFKKNGSISLERLLVIMANVLRNSEGVENKALKERAYSSLVKYSLVWMVLYRESLIDYVLKNKKLPSSIPKNIDFETFLKYLPLSIQGGMNKHVGTPKLAKIVLGKMKIDLKSNTTSNLETFLSVSLYSDIQGNGFPNYLKMFAKSLKKNIVRDYLFLKIIHYYYQRTRSGSPNEEIYLNILALLRMRTLKIPQRMKLKVVDGLKDAKKLFEDKST